VDFDVAVIGAGPIGSVAARSAAEAGAKVLLVDRRDGVDRSSACTGLITSRTLEILGVSRDCILRQIRAVSVYAPDGQAVRLAADHPKAIVVDRARLERELHASAVDAGVDLRLGVEAIAASPGGVVLRTPVGIERVMTSVLIGADGPGGQVARWIGLPPPGRLVRAAQAVVEAPLGEAEIEIHLGRKMAPGFFAWAVPAEGPTSRVGLGVCAPHDPVQYLERFLSSRFAGRRVLSRSGGTIPISPAARTVRDGALLVGDAAGQVKPLSGGGLYPGAVCARIAGRIAAQACRAGGGSLRGLAAYESEWRLAVGRDIAFGQAMRFIADSLSDQELSAALSRLDAPPLRSFLSEHADIDQLHLLPDRLAAHPPLWSRVLDVVPLLAGHEPLGSPPVGSSGTESL